MKQPFIAVIQTNSGNELSYLTLGFHHSSEAAEKYFNKIAKADDLQNQVYAIASFSEAKEMAAIAQRMINLFINCYTQEELDDKAKARPAGKRRFKSSCNRRKRPVNN
jgi:folylpolyglutamate synthase/dihydropteroate synthase